MRPPVLTKPGIRGSHTGNKTVPRDAEGLSADGACLIPDDRWYLPCSDHKDLTGACRILESESSLRQNEMTLFQKNRTLEGGARPKEEEQNSEAKGRENYKSILSFPELSSGSHLAVPLKLIFSSNMRGETSEKCSTTTDLKT